MRTLLLSLLLSLSLVGPCWAGASMDFDGVAANNDTISFATTDYDTVTFAGWVMVDAAGDTNFPRMVETPAFAVLINLTAGCSDDSFQFVSKWSTNGNWCSSINTVEVATKYHLAVTYDQSVTTNDPLLYINGVSVTVTQTGADPSGSNTSNLGTGYWGNRSDLTRTLDGRLGFQHIYNRILSVSEIIEIMHHPGSITSGLVTFHTMMDTTDQTDLSGNGATGTNSGAVTSSNGFPVFLTSPISSWHHFWRSLASWLIPEVYADDVILCDPADPTVPNRVVGYERSADPVKSGASTNPNSLIYSLPPSTIQPWDGVTPPGSSATWKCSGNTVITMTQTEQDAINAPAVAEAALQASYDAEVTGNDLCSATLAEIDSRINTTRDSLNTEIAAIGNLAQARTVMTSMNTTYAAAFRKIARCIKSRLR